MDWEVPYHLIPTVDFFQENTNHAIKRKDNFTSCETFHQNFSTGRIRHARIKESIDT